MTNPEPQKEHRWLRKLVGEWTFEVVGETPAGAAEECGGGHTGTESARSLGDVWVLAEGNGVVPGAGPARTLMTLGYDPAKGRFVGTWIGSMMTHLWVYDGELDAEGRTLTLHAEGPSMAGDGTIGKYRDVIEFVDDDYRLLKSYFQGADGGWAQFVTGHYRRTA